MHLQQTKRGSRESGGPQYYFHGLTTRVKKYLRRKGVVEVALVTPYGATKSEYLAVSSDKKVGHNFRPVLGNVGHDRIQQGRATESIGEAIRKWFRLESGDFERIDVDIEVRDKAFYVTPLACKYAGRPKTVKIRNLKKPLTFTVDHQSGLWLNQMYHLERAKPGIVWWAVEEIKRIVKDHQKATRLLHVQEQDILRASGPLKHLGMSLGGYVGKGYDCKTEFQFLKYPTYIVPVELKKNSKGFKYQQQKYGKNELSRAVLLCATHGYKELPAHIDVIELDAIAQLQPMSLRSR